MIIALLLEGVFLHIEKSNTCLFEEPCCVVSGSFPCEYFKKRDKSFKINSNKECQ